MTRTTPPVPLTPLPEDDDTRLLRGSLVVAALVHLGLLFLPMPWTGAAATPEPPPRVIHRLADLRPMPPEPPPTDVEPPPPQPQAPTPIPVPDFTVDEPPLETEPPPLPVPDDVPDVPVMLVDDAPPPLPTPEPAEPAEEGPIYVVGAVEPPVKLEAPAPAYTELARRARAEGKVIVQVVIDEEGRVTDVKVLRAVGFGLTEAAVQAVERWRFEPARLEGRAVSVYYNLTVRFTLQ